MIDNIAQEIGVPGWLLVALLVAGVVAFLATAVAYAAEGLTGVLRLWLKWPIKYGSLGAWKLFIRPVGLYSGKGLMAGYKSLIGTRAPRVADPTSAELEKRQSVDPGRPPGIGKVRGVQELRNGLHTTVGGVVKAVHKAIVGMSGSGKNETDLNYELQHQLENSDEHIILTDPKKRAPQTRIVYEHARPEDRIFIYSFHPHDSSSSSLRLFKDPGEVADLAYMLCDDPDAQDSHWNEKSAEGIAAIAMSQSEIKAQADRAAAKLSGVEDGRGTQEITVTLNEVRDVMADRRKLEELRDISPLVDNVADVAKEWGLIRSTATRRLAALSDPTVRRVFAGGPDTPQPDFSRRDGRDIVIIRPYPRSAKRLVRYIYAVLDATYRAAADGGDAGGPGTKVLIDEAASYMKLENLDEYLDLGRESKVQLTYVLQSVKQLAAKLDHKKAEHIIASTEVKVIGKTDDYDTAEMMSKLSRPTMVHYGRPAQRDEIMGEIGEHQRRLIEPHEITAQREGEWTIQHGEHVWKVGVPEDRYHHRQAGTPKRRSPWGQVDPETYKVPPILGPADDEDGPEKPVADRRGPAHAEDDILDDGDDREGGDDWIA